MTIDQSGGGAKVSMLFSLKDAEGNPIDLPIPASLDLYIAKLLPATDDRPAQWQSLVSRSTGGTTTAPTKVLGAYRERGSTDAANATRGDVIRVSAGTYQYTFGTDLVAVGTFKYSATRAGKLPFPAGYDPALDRPPTRKGHGRTRGWC